MSFYPGELEVRIVSEDIIREAFNSGQFWERAQQGEFIVRVHYNKHYNRRQAREKGFTYCTHSQAVRYYLDDETNLIAVMHQIRNPDGTLGTSGKPDPKFLKLGNQILKTN